MSASHRFTLRCARDDSESAVSATGLRVAAGSLREGSPRAIKNVIPDAVQRERAPDAKWASEGASKE